ncbi:MAG: zinc metalloprotease HtpX [Armatimonadetes bacterium]|nr:zinc metalloprotease HtpX [Candidatus Hippobium faecium]
MNQIKTFFLMIILTGILMFLGDYFGSSTGMAIGLGIGIISNFISYFFSDKIVLASYGAKDVSEDHRLYRIVKNLTAKSGMPMPRVCIIPESSPNAFATGRNPNHAAVCATSGILNLLDDNELEGVLAHELSHIKNRDILVSTIAAGICGIIAFICRIGVIFGVGGDRKNSGCLTLVVLLFSSVFATLIQLWISRTREYMADESGAKLCGKPWALADALEKLSQGVSHNPMEQATPETRNMFIINPIAPMVANLFSTHPPINDRIKKLKNMNMNIY